MGTFTFAGETIISEKIVSLPVDIGKAKLKFTNLAEDYDSIKKTREITINLVEEDPELSSKENIDIKNYLKNNIKSNINWSRIS